MGGWRGGTLVVPLITPDSEVAEGTTSSEICSAQFTWRTLSSRFLHKRLHASQQGAADGAGVKAQLWICVPFRLRVAAR